MTTSSPPNAAVAAATARCAPAGSERSAATACAAMPSAVSSAARSRGSESLRPATRTFAPARPSPRATAYPIWPARPTPVTSAILPRRSAVTRLAADCRDDVVDGRRAALREPHAPGAIDDVHRSLDAFAVVLQRVVGRGDLAVGVAQQRKVEAEGFRVLQVTLDPGRVDAEGPDVRLLELLDLIAHGGELTVSAGGVVARIENRSEERRVGKAER